MRHGAIGATTLDAALLNEVFEESLLNLFADLIELVEVDKQGAGQQSFGVLFAREINQFAIAGVAQFGR